MMSVDGGGGPGADGSGGPFVLQHHRAAAPQASDDLASVAKLEGTQRFRSIMARVSAALSQVEKEAAEEEKAANKGREAEAGPSMHVDLGDLDEDAEDEALQGEIQAVSDAGAGTGDGDTYALLVECNALAVDVDAEVPKVGGRGHQRIDAGHGGHERVVWRRARRRGDRRPCVSVQQRVGCVVASSMSYVTQGAAG